jgi:hypothetical protein
VDDFIRIECKCTDYKNCFIKFDGGRSVNSSATNSDFRASAISVNSVRFAISSLHGLLGNRFKLFQPRR